MKKYNFLYLITITAIMTGCSPNNQSTGNIPFIDVGKNYPEKEIILTDIADVSYIHLSTENDDYLYKGRIKYVTENTIVVVDNSSNSILFFNKDGKPKSRFNRYGQGPQEYQGAGLLYPVYDEITDEIFAGFSISNIIKVYSSSGEYKRTLTLPEKVDVQKIIPFDEKSFLVFDGWKIKQKTGMMMMSGKMDPNFQTDSSFFLISKTDGKVLDYVKMPFNDDVDLTIRYPGGFMFSSNATRAVKCTEGAYLCNYETDTVFLYSNKDKSLTPVMCKTPLVSNLDSKITLCEFMEADKYEFITVRTNIYRMDGGREKYYLRDKITGEIFRQKIILPDYKGKELFITPVDLYINSDKTQIFIELQLYELKQAYKENKLSGKLKDLVATLNEDIDNNIYMFVTFK